MDGDRDAARRAKRDIADFNRAQREISITLDGLRRSMQARRCYSQQAEHGVGGGEPAALAFAGGCGVW